MVPSKSGFLQPSSAFGFLNPSGSSSSMVSDYDPIKPSISGSSLESASSEAPLNVFNQRVFYGVPSKDSSSYTYAYKMQSWERRVTIGVILTLFVIRFRPLWLLIKGTSAFDVIVLTSNWIDAICLAVESVLAIYSLYCYLKPLTKVPAPDAEYPTHFITLLVYKESNDTVRRLIKSIAATTSKGSKVLVLGCQKETEDKLGKIAVANEFDCFDDVIMSILEKDDTMIRGACSNVFHAQKCIINYAQVNGVDMSNSIFWKFDANCIMEDDMIREVDERWVTMPKEERAGAIFIGATFFQTVIDNKEIFSDNDRSLWNIGFWTWKSLEAYFFRYMATAVVCLSLEGMMKAQLTNPGMVAEDELTPWKIRATQSQTSMIRLDSRVIKAMPVPSSLKFYYAKALRWDIGGLENVIYMIKWALGHFDDGHIKMTNKTSVFIHTFRQMFQRFFWTSNMFLIGLWTALCPSVVNPAWWQSTGFYVFGMAMIINISVQLFTITTLYHNSKWVKVTAKTFFGVFFGVFLVQPMMAIVWQTAYYVDVFIKGGFEWPVFSSTGKMHLNKTPEQQMNEKTPLLWNDTKLNI